MLPSDPVFVFINFWSGIVGGAYLPGTKCQTPTRHPIVSLQLPTPP